MFVTAETEEFKKFIAGLEPILNNDAVHATMREIDFEERSKFILVFTKMKNDPHGCQQRHAYCFIARCDTESKALGKVKAGDVLKCASWKAPAKHARGNIFADNPHAGCNKWGTDYLR